MKQQHSLGELAALVKGEVFGDPDLLLQGLNGLELAGPGEITFLVETKKATGLATCKASAVIVPLDLREPGLPALRVADPNLAAAIIHQYFLSSPFVARGVHPSAQIGKDCLIDRKITIDPLVVLGDRVELGPRVSIGPGTVIGDDVRIGEDSQLQANVTVMEGCRIGRRTVIQPGAVIGSDGFGFATDRSTGRHVKKPQVGIVIIGDDVEIGANTCIDRAAFGTTVIRDGARIDNLVQVAHNVEVGENSVLVAQVGIAGSTVLGRNVVLGGHAGVAGHLRLEDGVMAAAMSGVHNDQKKGAVIGGAPAIEIRQWGKATAVYTRLPELRAELRDLKKKVAELENLLREINNREEEHGA